MNVSTTFNAQILERLSELERSRVRLISFQNKLLPLLDGVILDEEVTTSLNFYNESFDFDNLTHAQVLSIIQKTGLSPWKKTLCGEGRINYVYDLGDGYSLRCWNCAPPPSCRIEEVEEVVPAQEATTRKVRRLICKD